MPDVTGDIPRPRTPDSLLASSEARYEALLANLPSTGLLLFDHDLRLLVVTGETGPWLGVEPEKIVGRTLGEVLPPQQAVFLTGHQKAALAGERRALDMAGSPGPGIWEVTFTPVRDSDGAVVAGMAAARDVTLSRDAKEQAAATREQLQTIVDNTPARIFMKDLDGRYLLANRETERVLARPRGGLVGLTDKDVLPGDVADQMRTADRQAVESLRPVHVEERFPWPDGSVHTYLVVKFPLRGPHGRAYAVCGIATDITARKEMERALRESERQFWAVFNSATVGMALIHFEPDGSAAMLRVNDALCTISGRAREDLERSDPWTLLPVEQRVRFALRLNDMVRGEPTHAVVEHENQRPDGTRVFLRVVLSLVDEPGDDGRLLFAHVEDITEQRRAEEELRYRALHDQLTGLPNRSLLEERMRHALDRLERHGGVLGILFVDVDDFKRVNDAHGHGAGDEVLRRVAHLVRTVLRTSDTAARLGGDEFVVVCEDLETEREAVLVGERLLDVLRQSSEQAVVDVTASVGVAATSDATIDPETLLAQADLALQQAKHQGKDRVVVFRPELLMPT